MPWWEEELERLREEQRPKKVEQPFLRLPIPTMPLMPPPTRDTEAANDDADSDRGVCYIDM